MHKFKVCELFAGVGGFRLGLEATDKFEIVWSNQWEPSTKKQHASEVYEARFGSEGHSNEDIETVPTVVIPDHDVLVGGFPCQDYSVATTLKNSKGLLGKKGVLWWSIHRILAEKDQKPSFLILENVDRLLKSPSKQRGRDFAIMLNGLSALGYAVEWRVINAADYGFPQRRRRVFLVGIHKEATLYDEMERCSPAAVLSDFGVLAKAFPVKPFLPIVTPFSVSGDLVTLSNTFNLNAQKSPFSNAGICIDGQVYTTALEPNYHGLFTCLQDILIKNKVPEAFFIPSDDLQRWEYLKGAKKEQRVTREGFVYNYSEGGMVFPDALDKPSRTIITGEGGKSPSRFKHVVKTPKGLRRLLPVELERLNGFPDGHTQLDGISDAKRAFFMGNALVVGLVERIGQALAEKVAKSAV